MQISILHPLWHCYPPPCHRCHWVNVLAGNCLEKLSFNELKGSSTYSTLVYGTLSDGCSSHQHRPRSLLNAVDTWQWRACTLWPERTIDLNTVVICQWQGLTVAGHPADKEYQKINKCKMWSFLSICGGSMSLSVDVAGSNVGQEWFLFHLCIQCIWKDKVFEQQKDEFANQRLGFVVFFLTAFSPQIIKALLPLRVSHGIRLQPWRSLPGWIRNKQKKYTFGQVCMYSDMPEK